MLSKPLTTRKTSLWCNLVITILLPAALTDFTPNAKAQGGIPLWTNRYHGVSSGRNGASGIAVDNAGSVFVTGVSQSANGDQEYATIKYSSSIQPYLAIQKTYNQALLTWTNTGFVLQSAPGITDSFTNIPGAASPYATTSPNDQQYFRLTAP